MLDELETSSKNRAEVDHDNDESMTELRTEGPRLAGIKTAISQ
jgi:hypothetical protein